MSDPGFSCESERAGFAQFASCARWLLHVRMLRALRRRFLPWDLVIVVAGSCEFVVGFGSVYGIGVGSGGGMGRVRC